MRADFSRRVGFAALPPGLLSRPMAKIIISYRRSDSQAMAGRIFDRLSAHYGEGAVFMDIDAIPFGIDFRKHIGDVLRQCDLLIAVVGPHWLGRRDDGGNRIGEPSDPVRVELEGAIERKIPVIPVLIDGGRMPGEAELPDSLKEFSFFNAAPVDSGRDFRSHMDRLVRALDGMLAGKGGTAAGQTAAAAALAAQMPAAPKAAPARLAARRVWLALAGVVLLGGAGALLLATSSSWLSKPGRDAASQGQQPAGAESQASSPPAKPTITLKSADKYIAQVMAKELKDNNVNLAFELDEAASSQLSDQLWDRLVGGEIDLASLSLDGLDSKVPAFAATNMPGLVRSHEQARRVSGSPFMTQIKRMAAAAGVIVLGDSWTSISVISKKGCVRRPDDVKGLKIYALGASFEVVLQAAGAILIDSTEDFSTIFRSSADAMVVSPVSALQVAELARCVTIAGDYTLGFSYLPWLISKKTVGRLNRDQQDALLKVGERMSAEGYKDVDDYLTRMLGASGVQTITLSEADHEAWVRLARATVYRGFAAKVPEGKQLIDEALAVK
jgi:TRAP-type transport system periplasmic protein